MQLPNRFSPPLPDGSYVLGDRLIALVEKYWILPDGSLLVLDEWQKWLIRAVLETRADGTMRYRQVLISVPRQQGKSLLGAIFQLWGLLQHKKGPSVVGLATSVKQANIVYNRVAHTINSNPALSKRLKATGTRGIRHKDGAGTLYVLPAKEEAVQGEPVSLGLIDELHILKPGIWNAVVNGQRSISGALVIGITTAGDDTSELLLSLYEKSNAAIEDPESTFGAFIWEAPAGSKVTDVEAILQANPAVACGRIDIKTVLADTEGLPAWDVKRYLLNQFVSNINAWIDPMLWMKCGYSGITDYSSGGLYLAIDVTPSMSHATFAVARKTEDGYIETELIASINQPTWDYLKKLCDGLTYKVEAFVIDPYNSKDLVIHLEKKGKTVIKIDGGGNVRAASTAHSLIAKGKVRHNRDELLKRLVPMGQAKAKGDSWRIVKTPKGPDIDPVFATVYAIYAAATQEKPAPQLFVHSKAA